jgi:hypothetical protein
LGFIAHVAQSSTFGSGQPTYCAGEILALSERLTGHCVIVHLLDGTFAITTRTYLLVDTPTLHLHRCLE